MTAHRLEGPVRMSLLAKAMTLHMRARHCAEAIAADGEIIRGKFGNPAQHPLIAPERGATLAYLRTLRQLGVSAPK